MWFSIDSAKAIQIADFDKHEFVRKLSKSVWKLSRLYRNFIEYLKAFQSIRKLLEYQKKFGCLEIS